MANIALTVMQAFDQAVTAFKAGKLIEAEQLCQQITTAKHDFFDAFHLLAFVQSKLGKKEVALTSYNYAITLRPDSAEALNNRGNILQELKRLDEALASYDRAIGVRPDYAEALNNRGNALLALKRYEDALASYDRALALRRDYGDALYNRGRALQELQQFDEALAAYDRAIALRPDHADALCSRGNILQRLKRLDEALACYDRALAVRPDYAKALNNRGNALQELKRFDEALVSYDRAIAVRPDYAEALSNRGIALEKLSRFEEALASYDKALAVRPDYTEVLNNRGNALMALKRYKDALASYDRALSLRPDYDAQALNNRGRTLKELKRFEEALASYDRALAVRPDYTAALSNRGVALQKLKRFDEALASYDRALALRPAYAEALTNRGNVLEQLMRLDEALASYDRAIAARPHLAEAHYNQALCRLLIGDFDRGWQEHEWRWETYFFRNSKRSFNQPQWVGQDISGKTILLHAEQGYGDTIQFCRYVPMVAERGARVVLQVPQALRELMSTLAGAPQIVSKGDPRPIFDIHCPLLSVPLAFGTRLHTIPAATPYLHASPRAMRHWAKQLRRKRRPRIGVAWSGREAHPNDRNRSMRLSSLLPLFEIDATFVSLQKDIRADDLVILKDHSEFVDLGGALKDFSDTAALMMNLDLVISVDTSVAHLAGALAKPVWVLLPIPPDWRWLLDRDDSPWYPTARLFRQDETRTWDNVIGRVRMALSDFVQRHS